MSENENGTPPPADPNESEMTAGMPTPAESADGKEGASTVTDSAQEASAKTEGATSGESSAFDISPKSDESSDASADDQSEEAQAEAKEEAEEEIHRALVWPIDPDHANAIGLLSEQLDGVKSVDIEASKKTSRALNLLLLIACIAIGTLGTTQLSYYASPDREARLTELALCKVDRTSLEQETANYEIERYLSLGHDQNKIETDLSATYNVDNARSKKLVSVFKDLKREQGNAFFGLAGKVSIVSEPKNARIYKRRVGEKDFKPVMVMKKGKEVVAYTPYTVQIEDITASYEFELRFTDELKRFKELTDEEKKALPEGEKPPVEVHEVKYRNDGFKVSRYQWIKDGGSGEFSITKMITMIPDYVEHYNTFNWAKNKTEEFETLEECTTYQKENDDTTLCRAIPRLENWDKEDERREEAEKNKKGKRRRGRRR
jgi:hypothetical protein